MELTVTEPALVAPRTPALARLRRLFPARTKPPAFDVVVRQHHGMVRGFLRRLCDADAIADDLVQETFLKAERALPGFRGDGSMASWLLRIAYREFLSQKRKKTHALVGDFDHVDDDGAGRRADRTLERDVRRAVTALSDDERAAVAACFFDDLTHEEAAAALDMPLGTLKSHVARAKEKLRAPLAAYAPQEASDER